MCALHAHFQLSCSRCADKARRPLAAPTQPDHDPTTTDRCLPRRCIQTRFLTVMSRRRLKVEERNCRGVRGASPHWGKKDFAAPPDHLSDRREIRGFGIAAQCMVQHNFAPPGAKRHIQGLDVLQDRCGSRACVPEIKDPLCGRKRVVGSNFADYFEPRGGIGAGKRLSSFSTFSRFSAGFELPCLEKFTRRLTVVDK